ncbi:MAG: phosphoribosylformylglycinamidine synthase subunit PurQ [Clostridia bacterium]|nr:phosphoribosylformylglycinamidine synthase subunit PurQ [Clostridia bacterium]
MRKLFLIEKKSEYANAARRLYRRVTEELELHTVTEVRILRCLIFDGWDEATADLVPASFLYDRTTERVVDESEIRTLAGQEDAACICVIPLFRRPAEHLTEDALRMMTADLMDGKTGVSENAASGTYDSENTALSSDESDAGVSDSVADDSLEQNRIWFRQADVFVFHGTELSDEDVSRLKKMLINPASATEFPLFSGGTLPPLAPDADEGLMPVRGFREMDDEALSQFVHSEHFRMSEDDMRFIRSYFRVEEKRDPNRFELRMIDTYWSDHCRHITFLTALQDLEICDREISETFELYLETREALYGTRPKNITLMDIATVPAKYLARTGRLVHDAETGERNAFTVRVNVNTEQGTIPWFLHYKNETHNYSTEREPYLGAFSSFGATIADPLSARAEVFAAMRLSGLGYPSAEDAEGFSVQRMATETADGFAAFGVQTGIPTGYVREWLHPGFAAKHMEVCFSAAAAPIDTDDVGGSAPGVPAAGDIIVLVGARTGRDGLGGGLNASAVRVSPGGDERAGQDDHPEKPKKHRRNTYTSQIGDPQASRSLLRMMRRGDVRRLVRRAADVGSGGLAVAAAELAGGVRIDLDRVPTSVSDRIVVGGMMTPNEIAFSETQARMLLVVPADRVTEIAEIAASEDLDASIIGVVTSERRCRLLWWEQTLLSLSRDFLDATGAERRVSAYIPPADTETLYRGISDHLAGDDLTGLYLRLMMHPEVASHRGLSERFDATAGGRTAVMPFGGRRMLTPTDYMAVRFPTVSAEQGETHTCAVFSCGYLPRHAEQSPYHGAYLAVLTAICRLAAAGVALRDMTLSLQEYFPTTGDDPVRFGVPFAAMLGAFRAQMDYEVAAVGGKDSMNGTRVTKDGEQYDVPPTVIAFGAATAEQEDLITPEFKKAGSRVYLLAPVYGENRLPDPAEEKNLLTYLHTLARDGKILSCMAVTSGGVAAAVAQMCFGNHIGFNYEGSAASRILFEDRPGSFLVETDFELRGVLLGWTKDTANILLGSTSIPLSMLADAWLKPQEKLYADLTDTAETGIVAAFPYKSHSIDFPAVSIPHPKVLLPVLPYLTGEDVLAARFEAVGIEPVKLLFACRNRHETRASIETLAKTLARPNVGLLAFAGGSYPGYGSVPVAISDPAARFAQAVFTTPSVFDALLTFCERESHLILGLGEGFRMLLASGVFYGDGKTPTGEQIGLTENPCGHLVSRMVRVRTMSVSSPWMRYAESGDIFTLPVASKAGRCVIPGELVLDLGANGLIASQYVDADGNPTLNTRFNPFLSDFAVEGVFARDGRIFGRMAHCDRVDNTLCTNIPGNKETGMFRAAADYFRIKI